MRYSYEFKKECVKLYHEGKWPETPLGIKNEKNFHDMIVRWSKMVESSGFEALQHKSSNKKWTANEKLVLVEQVLAGNSIQSVALGAGLNSGLVYQWVRKYKLFGYNGLVDKKKGRKSRESNMDNTSKPRKLTESEYEELIRLRAENEYIKAENAVIKKEIALREEKEAAQLKAKRQQSSKNSVKKDTN